MDVVLKEKVGALQGSHMSRVRQHRF